ncbi:MAG TPA: sigma-70 family RNA polymerase sigma factor [Rhodothermales bacterium]|nr:sigma-70 family RNA polymerase sigma factor [Rhodothermales bacterium]
MAGEIERHSIQYVARHLSFSVDDVERAAEAFRLWREQESDAAKRDVDLWTYCFVRRYFLAKLARTARFSEADFEELISQAYLAAQSKSSQLRDPERYPHWVSKICKNRFLSYLNQNVDSVPLPDEMPADFREPILDESTKAAVAVASAIQRLPDSLRDVTYQKLIEKRSYNEIERATGKDEGTLRSYISKARAKLRGDLVLRKFINPD